jgi:hypothetical protein
MAIVQIKAEAHAMNFVYGEPADGFFILAGIYFIRSSIDVG